MKTPYLWPLPINCLTTNSELYAFSRNMCYLASECYMCDPSWGLDDVACESYTVVFCQKKYLLFIAPLPTHASGQPCSKRSTIGRMILTFWLNPFSPLTCSTLWFQIGVSLIKHDTHWCNTQSKQQKYSDYSYTCFTYSNEFQCITNLRSMPTEV